MITPDRRPTVKERQLAAMAAQGAKGRELRSARAPAWPWPPVGDPIVATLVARAIERAVPDGYKDAIEWAVIHGYFEGAIAASVRTDSPPVS